MKRYRITNKYRFVAFMVSVILIMTATIGIILGSNTAEGSSETKFETISIQYGDTMWTLADEYAPESMDVRTFINKVCKENNIKSGELYVGQDIRVPVA